MFKKLFWFFLVGLFFPWSVLAKEANVVIINQVRGEEVCCQPGNLVWLEKVKEQNLHNQLPLAWALRHDALKSKQFLESLKEISGEFGLLLEITPALAKESNVFYKGLADGSDWHYARNAFLPGYQPEERKKLIDTLFSSFKKEFGYYPSFTVSWVIDAWSLNYLQKSYQVKIHEITKEQYETDSYTLYGGIFNKPYYPFKYHPLLPGFGQDKLDLLIVRQTVSGPLLNYGSAKAYYTSQPNDYLTNPDQQDLNYFEKLIDTAINQSDDFNFLLLGMENSFSWEKYGQEYLKQLNLILDRQREGKIKVKSPTTLVADFKKNYSENRPFFLTQDFFSGSDYGVFWYFGRTYRARVIVKNKEVIIDDLRNFSPLTDPYYQTPVPFDSVYFIIPYLFDGSQQYTLTAKQQQELDKKELLFDPVISDQYTNPFGIVIKNDSFALVTNEDNVEIKFSGSQSGSLKFFPDVLQIEESLEPYFNYPTTLLTELIKEKKSVKFSFPKHFDLISQNKDNQTVELGWLREEKFIPLFSLTKQTDWLNLVSLKATHLEFLTPIFQPDKTDLPVDSQNSVFYWHNQKAVAGRNPIRLFILPLNQLKRPTKVSQVEVKTKKEGNLHITYPEDFSFRIRPWFIDLWSDQPIQTEIVLTIDGIEVVRGQKIEFVTDCKKNMRSCLTSWPQGIKYISIIFNEYKKRLTAGLHSLWKR